ncbi:hypothetical protein RCO48_02230 [Peribacillus frigoritolerans]|nr:hypothetical protein [Peribacillus frigoritolerans]
MLKGRHPFNPSVLIRCWEGERESVEGSHQIQDNDRGSAYGAGTYQYEMGMSVSKDLTAGMTGKGRFINEIV